LLELELLVLLEEPVDDCPLPAARRITGTL
jgi:hypothetical protein